MVPEKPPEIASDPLMSAAWDEEAGRRDLSPADGPTLALLCRWRKVAARACEEMDALGGQTAYEAASGDLKPLPQVATLRAASAEIRALTRALGEGEGAGGAEPIPDNVLTLVRGRRAQRRAGADL